MSKLILFIDMDNTICDFSGSIAHKYWEKKERNPSGMFEKNFFRDLEPLPGAIAAIKELINSNLYDIFILTQPVSSLPSSYAEKAAWVLTYLPELKDKIIMCQDKKMIKGDILIDDDEKWRDWGGLFYHFFPESHPMPQWLGAVEYLLTFNVEEDLEWLRKENLT